MSYCCPHSQSAGRLFSRFARNYKKRFKKRGFEPSQKQLIAGLEQVGYQEATLLEIGSGVGHLHQSLLERGAKSAQGIDLAPKMLEEATAWAEERGLAHRTKYIVGDFVDLTDQVAAADVTVLDKVVCCYPDADALVHKSLDKTKRVYALTYPRGRWFIHFGAAVGAFIMWLFRSDFRAYVHDPAMIEAWITAKGFNKRYEAKTSIWLTQVYEKK